VVPLNKPWNKLSKKHKDALLLGTGEKRYQVEWKAKSGGGTLNVRWEGLIPRLLRRMTESKSERAKQYYSQFLGTAECSACRGARLRAESAAVRVAGKTLVEVSALTVRDALGFFSVMGLVGSDAEIAGEVL
jgi:excinuclease ABC subunit A